MRVQASNEDTTFVMPADPDWLEQFYWDLDEPLPSLTSASPSPTPPKPLPLELSPSEVAAAPAPTRPLQRPVAADRGYERMEPLEQAELETMPSCELLLLNCERRRLLPPAVCSCVQQQQLATHTSFSLVEKLSRQQQSSQQQAQIQQRQVVELQLRQQVEWYQAAMERTQALQVLQVPCWTQAQPLQQQAHQQQPMRQAPQQPQSNTTMPTLEQALHIALHDVQTARTDAEISQVVRTLAIALGASRTETGTIKALHAVLLQLLQPGISDAEACSLTAASNSNFAKWRKRMRDAQLL